VQQVRSRAKRLHRKHNLGVLIVDYPKIEKVDTSLLRGKASI
jgi:replicative DNA helicase